MSTNNRAEARDRAILALTAMILQQEQQTQQTFGDVMRPMRTHRPFDIDEVDDVDIDDSLLSKACAICACDFRERDKYVKVVPKCHHAFHELCLVKVRCVVAAVSTSRHFCLIDFPLS
jgi:hypothetical protein